MPLDYQKHEQTNPSAHADGPYALRYASNRPEGNHPTIADAVKAARGPASVVTRNGWWLVGRIEESEYEEIDLEPDEIVGVLAEIAHTLEAITGDLVLAGKPNEADILERAMRDVYGVVRSLHVTGRLWETISSRYATERSRTGRDAILTEAAETYGPAYADALVILHGNP